jgi:UDP-4-amino-4,6-dideoxy-N-acetyl-beta-L-altrosamine transaminase
MNIPYSRQYIDEDDIQAVVETLRSDYLTTGPKVDEFERAVADYVGAKHAVAVCNGTAALHIGCLAAGITTGDEVITSPITFAASANCVLYCGGKPVFADIDPKTYNIDPEDIERKITPRTKMIIPVHYTGQPCDMDAIHDIAKRHNLLVFEDAAHAIGAEYKGKRIGALSDMTEFSFHPVKLVTTGEGGVVTTNDEKLYQRLKLFRTHGITREKALLNCCEGDWYYEQLELGYNYRITDFQCALGMTQLSKLDRSLARRQEIAMTYDIAFADVEGITTPYQPLWQRNSYHLYVVQVEAERRNDIFNQLRQAGVCVNLHYIPVYKHPYYQRIGYRNVSCPNAERLYSRIISLPMYYGIADAQIEYIASTVNSVINA